MTFLVPFDGTPLSEAALARAAEFGTSLDVPVLALTVIPAGNDDYAVEKGWLDEDEPYDPGVVVERLRSTVESVAPRASFRHRSVYRYAGRGGIASEIRRIGREEDADVVFVGSESAGRLVTSLLSVGASVAADREYDVFLVRTPPSDES